MDIKNYLPLGSIVRLKGGTRKLIIIGIKDQMINHMIILQFYIHMDI